MSKSLKSVNETEDFEKNARADLPAVHMHSLLAWQGGAARVMRLLARELAAQGCSVDCSSEINDSAEAEAVEKIFENNTAAKTAANTARARVCNSPASARALLIAPTALAKAVPASSICHVHSTQNWPKLCGAFAAQRLAPQGKLENFAASKLCITMHDCALLTGGCLAPPVSIYGPEGITPGPCSTFAQGCREPCPLHFEKAAKWQKVKKEALLAAAPCLVAPSGWLLRMAKKCLPELDCRLIPNGVEDNPHAKNKRAAKQALGLLPEALLVLFVAHGGLAAKAKGAGNWLPIWQNIKNKIPQAVAFMVGGEELGRQSDLFHWPYVQQARLQQFMAAADVFVYPSLADNHPLVVLEAMSAGTPVCAYATGGIVEQVEDGVSGFLVQQGEAGLLSSRAVRVLSEPLLRRGLGQSGRAAYEKHFQAVQMAACYLDLYRELLGVVSK